MELNILENMTVPVLSRLDTLIHIQGVLNSNFVSAKDVVAGVHKYQRANTFIDTPAAQTIHQWLTECNMTNDTPGFQEWLTEMERMSVNEDGGVIIIIDTPPQTPVTYPSEELRELAILDMV